MGERRECVLILPRMHSQRCNTILWKIQQYSILSCYCFIFEKSSLKLVASWF